jgi:hypothetical protein
LRKHGSSPPAGLATARSKQLESPIRSYYTDDMLALIVDGTDVEREVALLAEDASRMLHRAADPVAESADGG